MRFFRPVPRVTPAVPSAVPALADLYTAQWAPGEVAASVAAQLTPDAGDLEAWLRGGFEVYAATFDGRVVGAVRLAFATGACVIDMLAVAPGERRRGIGAYLLDYATARARRAGALRAWAVAPAELESMVELLPRHGFRRYAEHTTVSTGAGYALFELVL